jgi:malonyl-CoA O-methyltransferase
MFDKKLIKKNFSRCVATYNDSAVVQKYMAERLVQMLQEQGFSSFKKVLEIGAGTGLLTELMVEKIKINSYFANDIVNNYHEFITNISTEIKFLDGDIEYIELGDDLDLIIANAVFQWIADKDSFLKKVKSSLSDKGIFAFTTFLPDNFHEISDVFGVSLDYLDKENLVKLLEANFKVLAVVEQEKQLFFDDYLSVLSHIRDTGTNNLSVETFSKKQLLEKEILYKDKYCKNGKWVLTYKPIWLVCSV